MFVLRFGHPLHLCRGDTSYAIMEFYSMQLSTLGKHIATSGSLKIVATDSEDARTAKTEVRSLLGTLEGKVFGMCEWPKIVAFLHSESDIYLRGHRWEKIVSKRRPLCESVNAKRLKIIRNDDAFSIRVRRQIGRWSRLLRRYLVVFWK